HYVLTLTGEASEPPAQVGARLSAEATAGQPRAPEGSAGGPTASAGTAIVRQLSVRSMTMETNWQVLPGEHVRVEIAAPGLKRRVCLEGAAIRVKPKDEARGEPPFEIEVAFQTEIQRPRRLSSMTLTAVSPELIARAQQDGDEDVSRALDDLFAAIIRPAPNDTRRPTRHLSGLVSRIRLPTLFSLF